ncbi:hypothetical protein L1887_37702 [Cichorium endivia]|nr:hypothetical protein L1887_37702 [Cichorium endivia]
MRYIARNTWRREMGTERFGVLVVCCHDCEALYHSFCRYTIMFCDTVDVIFNLLCKYLGNCSVVSFRFNGLNEDMV